MGGGRGGGQRILPAAKVLAGRLEKDHSLTYTALADEYGVTRQAVTKALQRAKIEPKRPSPYSLKQFVPWRVKVQHEQHVLVRMLRVYAREQLGMPVPKDRRRMYARWRHDMDQYGLVVTYDPETGFDTDLRRDGDERYWRP